MKSVNHRHIPKKQTLLKASLVDFEKSEILKLISGIYRSAFCGMKFHLPEQVLQIYKTAMH
jgi:hypothetical protein